MSVITDKTETTINKEELDNVKKILKNIFRENGSKKSEEIINYENGKEISKEIKNYDESGNLIEPGFAPLTKHKVKTETVTIKDTQDNIKKKTKTSFHNNGNKKSEVISSYENGKQVSEEIKIYDERGNLIDLDFIPSIKKIIRIKLITTKDAKGNIKKKNKITLHENGNMQSEEITNYENGKEVSKEIKNYDEQGNLKS